VISIPKLLSGLPLNRGILAHALVPEAPEGLPGSVDVDVDADVL
jgi:hypothetical protein